MEKLILQSSIEAPILLAKIKEKKWWQGSLISCDALPGTQGDSETFQWWVITSQTCNLYISNFDKVPTFEVIAATEISNCDSGKIKGDNPRILHIEAQSEEKSIALELNIHKRQWLPRHLLADLSAPSFHVRDIKKNSEPDWFKKQWLDKLIGWLARSYNRVALPDKFNGAMNGSKLNDFLSKFAKKKNDDLYGIYLLIGMDRDNEDKWNGLLGEMPPPYSLGLNLIIYEDIDPEPLRRELLKNIFR